MYKEKCRFQDSKKDSIIFNVTTGWNRACPFHVANSNVTPMLVFLVQMLFLRGQSSITFVSLLEVTFRDKKNQAPAPKQTYIC